MAMVSAAKRWWVWLTRVCVCVALCAPALSPAAADGSGPLPDFVPKPLSPEDEARYRRIFALHETGDWAAADRVIATLSDPILMGHVLYTRYMHPTAYRSRYDELAEWLGLYDDHPGASRVYRLALRRRPAGAPEPSPPAVSGVHIAPAAAPPPRTPGDDVRDAVRQMVRRGTVTAALEHLKSPARRALMTDAQMADSLGLIVQGYFRHRYDGKAVRVAAEAVSVDSETAWRAQWWGGLAAWRQGDAELALEHFSGAALASGDPHIKSAGFYWASRASRALGDVEQAQNWARRGADWPRTFYGLLSARAAGMPAAFEWRVATLSYPSEGATLPELLSVPAVRRGAALAQAGMLPRASLELRAMAGRLSMDQTLALLRIAEAMGLADVTHAMGSVWQNHTGQRLDAAVWPIPRWAPDGGYVLDRALMYAVMRQESLFRVGAVSGSGARGLMQLMPTTASYMARRPFRGADRRLLHEPARNLALGQKYLEYLMRGVGRGGNLLLTVAAYNGGPSNVRRWLMAEDNVDDPLLFVESIPAFETRDYVRKVMANYWIYRDRLGQKSPSLDQLSRDEWPMYDPQDNVRPPIPPTR